MCFRPGFRFVVVVEDVFVGVDGSEEPARDGDVEVG